MNAATSFLDASVIYGNSQKESDSLRSFKSGQLLVQQVAGHKTLMPPDEQSKDCRFSYSHK